MLRALADRYDGGDGGWILVTSDDTLPAEQDEVIRERGATIATILPTWPEGLSQYASCIDVVHRHAHAMQRQAPHTVRRYGSERSVPWRPRPAHIVMTRRHPRKPSPDG